MDELEERVRKFNSLSLPGQPMGMHMGTSYLVNDLWREVQRLRGLTPLAPDGGDRRRLLRRIETLAWTLIESAQKGYISSNDVDLANDHLNKAQMALQTPTAGKA